MNAGGYWQLFLETGAPEMYLLYNKARKMSAVLSIILHGTLRAVFVFSVIRMRGKL